MASAELIKRKDREDDEIEIRLSDITQFLKKNRRHLLAGFFLGILIGSVYAFSKPNIFTSEVTVMPELQVRGSGSLGGLGSLAGLAGINLDNASAMDAVRPELYPNILRSVPFALHLVKQPVYSQKLKAKMTLQEFIRRINSDNFINGITTWLFSANKKNEEIKLDPTNFSHTIQISKEQEQLINQVQATITAVYDKKTGTLTITALEQDPVVAAIVAQLSLEYLTNYIISYRTEKSTKQVVFLTQRVREAKKRYQAVEYTLSNYRDRNRSLLLNAAKIEEQRLQAEYLLEQSVYNELSKQLEQARIKVQEETPTFKILDPPTVPLRKSGPKRTLIILGFGAAGLIISAIIALIRRFRLNVKPL